MAATPQIPTIVGGYIVSTSTNASRFYKNPSSTLNTYPYEYTVTLNITAVPNLDQGALGPSQFDATTITVGQWLLQNTGCAYLIVGINQLTSSSIVNVTIRDVDMYNALSDPTQAGTNAPSEGTAFIIFSLSDNGTPVITDATILNLTGSWLNDALGRFAYRNFIETYYNFDINNATIDYSTYSVGQIVYIGRTSSNNPYCFLPIDPTNPLHVVKAFGTVSSVNQPELSNIHVRPYGKLISTLPFILPGDPGDVLYYNASNAPSFCTNVAPATNAIPQYIKISSNVASVLYGTIGGGGGGGGGGNTTYNDSWIQSNFINPPPAITFGTVTGTSTSIFIPWTYPTQTAIGLVSSWVPVINSIASSLTYTTAGPTVQTVIPFSNGSNSFINYRDGSTFITGVVLSKQTGSSGVASITFPGESNARNAYIYYNPALSNIIASSSNTFKAWYKNTNTGSNVASTPLALFISAGPSSAVRSLALADVTSNAATVIFTPPLSNDITDANTLLTITNYNISYSTAGSTNRYGAPQPNSNTHDYATATSNLVSGLYPDSMYTFVVTPTNSGNQVGACNIIIGTTASLAPSPPISAITFPDRYYTNGTIVNVATGLTKTSLVNTNTNWVSTPFVAPIHTVASRGSQSNGIMSLSATLSNASVVQGPTLPFNGFPAAVPTVPHVNNMLISSSSVYDLYPTPAANSGFFLNSSNTVTLEAASFVASSSDYTLTVLQSNAVPSSATFTYQYDTPITTPPVITSIGSVLNSNVSAWVSGVKVVYGTPRYTVTSVLGNMGTYYYSSPLLTYTGTPTAVSPSTESNLTNITSGLGGGAFGTSITINNALITSADLVGSYSNALSIAGVAQNVYSNSASVVASIPVIVDGPSQTLIYTTLAQTLPSLVTSNAAIGFRVTSAISSNYLVPFNSNGLPYANTAYDNTSNITAQEELQVANGTFCTPTAQAHSYLNYSTYAYSPSQSNTANYSGISATGYRFATFAWRITPGKSYGATLAFTLSNLSANGTTVTLSNGIACAGLSRILLYYRFEDVASSAPTNLASYTSAWIDGNNTIGTSLTSANYYNPTTYSSATNWGLNTVAVNGTISTTFNVKSYPFTLGPTQEMRIYCRVGLPMSVPSAFSAVSATIT